jgi:restriction endonuclease
VKSVGVGVVNELIGRVASGMYKDLPVTLMTNARVTDGAREKAAQHGIKIIHHGKLAELIVRASGEPGNLAPAGRPLPRAATGRLHRAIMPAELTSADKNQEYRRVHRGRSVTGRGLRRGSGIGPRRAARDWD